MGKILFETDTATYEIEKSDAEVVEQFHSLTGIKIKLKPIVPTMAESSALHKISDNPTESKPINLETAPNKDDIIAFIESHLEGYNTPMVLEHFLGYVPKYGVSNEQDRILGMLNARINRARKVVAQERHGTFELVPKGAAKLYVFRQLNENETLPDISMDDDDENIQDDEREIVYQFPNKE